MLRLLAVVLALLASPAFAAVDRETAITTLAGLYNSADICNLSISRAKVDAYRDANAPAGDTMFNVDVFQATHKLYDQQKNWTAAQKADYCKTATATAKALDMGLTP